MVGILWISIVICQPCQCMNDTHYNNHYKSDSKKEMVEFSHLADFIDKSYINIDQKNQLVSIEDIAIMLIYV